MAERLVLKMFVTVTILKAENGGREFEELELSAAQAENGEFTNATATAERGEDLARRQGNLSLAEYLRHCADLFRRGEPLRVTQQA